MWYIWVGGHSPIISDQEDNALTFLGMENWLLDIGFIT